jgi:hypothetical protein
MSVTPLHLDTLYMPAYRALQFRQRQLSAFGWPKYLGRAVCFVNHSYLHGGPSSFDFGVHDECEEFFGSCDRFLWAAAIDVLLDTLAALLVLCYQRCEGHPLAVVQF